MNKVYIKNKVTVLVDASDLFVYETSVYLYLKNYFSLCNKKYFSSPVEIPGVVGSFFKNSKIQLCSELFAAPEKWLIENNYIPYEKPIKIRKIKLKKESNEQNTLSD